MSIYQNQGASCTNCFWQEDALKGDFTAKLHCKKCYMKDGRPGWDPKHGVTINYYQGQSMGKTVFIRKVVK
jgi:hypothetical protein